MSSKIWVQKWFYTSLSCSYSAIRWYSQPYTSISHLTQNKSFPCPQFWKISRKICGCIVFTQPVKRSFALRVFSRSENRNEYNLSLSSMSHSSRGLAVQFHFCSPRISVSTRNLHQYDSKRRAYFQYQENCVYIKSLQPERRIFCSHENLVTPE